MINLAAETRFGQSDPVYHEGIHKLSINCAKEAAKRGIKRYVEMSSGQMLSRDNKPITENEKKASPWTQVAKHKAAVEEQLKNVKDLNCVVLRPATVYGIGDRFGIMPRLIVGAIYKHLGEVMKLLWYREQKMNTVHVKDLVKAIWFVCTHPNIRNGEVFNVVDKGDTTQGTITDIISSIFNIKSDYYGKAFSLLAVKTTGFDELVEEINDKHMTPWSEICKKYNISNTPINPFLYPELLHETHLFMDGQKLEKLGFEYEFPKITKEALELIIDDYINMQLFPKFDHASK